MNLVHGPAGRFNKLKSETVKRVQALNRRLPIDDDAVGRLDL